MSDHDLNSLNLNSYKEDEAKSVEEDEETKAIHFSEPHRLVQSESENFCGDRTNSAISLRISVLSNKSEDVDCQKSSVKMGQLQRTKEMDKLSSLIQEDDVKSKKNQSENFHVGNVFKKLLDDREIDKIFQSPF